MSVINGFIIFLMFILLVYTLYRLFKKKSLLMLIPVCAQAFSLTIAVLSFVSNTEALQAIQAVYIALGILPPAIFLIIDYIRMIVKIRKQGVYEGLVAREEFHEVQIQSLPAEGINSISAEKPVHEIMNELKNLPEDLQKKFKKCLNKAYSLISEEDYNSACCIFETLSKIAESSAFLFFNTAGLCYKLKKFEDALENYRKAAELASGNTLFQYETNYSMGNTYFMLKRYDKAVHCYEKALELDPDNVKIIENLSFAYVRAGEKVKGIEILSKASMDESSYRAHFICGKLLNEAGKLPDAEAELNKCINIMPNSTEARNELANVLLKQDKIDAAVINYEEIIKYRPDDYGAWSGRANLLNRLKRWKEASDCYKKVVEIKPDSYKSFYNMAVALGECGKSKEAVEAFKNAISLKPDFIDAYNNLGITLSLMGRYDEALEVYEEGIKRKNRDFDLYFNMGMCLYETGRYMEAAAAYRNALDIKPEELEVYYYLGAALTELRHYNDAIDAYKSALKIKPSDGELHYNLAAVYAMLGRYDIAGENLKNAIQLDNEVRISVKNNKAFDGMRARNDFKELVG